MIIQRSLVVSLIGGALIVVSVFLPWISWTYSIPDFGTHSFSAMGLENDEGQLVLLLGLASIGILFVKQRLVRVGFGLLLVVVILLVIIYFHQRIVSYSFLLPSDVAQWHTQFGTYITLIGSLILIAGKLIDLVAKVNEEKQLPRSSLPSPPS
jgi:hypothetical protein